MVLSPSLTCARAAEMWNVRASSFFIRGFTNWGLSPTWSLSTAHPSYKGISTFCTKYWVWFQKSFSRTSLFIYVFLSLLRLRTRHQIFHLQILETPLGRAAMILIKSVRLFHRTSTLHSTGKKKGTIKLPKIRSRHGTQEETEWQFASKNLKILAPNPSLVPVLYLPHF
jgi:hypothetical protein